MASNSHRERTFVRDPHASTDDFGSGLSDIYVTCQLLADNKPLTIPFRTAYKAFTKEYM